MKVYHLVITLLTLGLILTPAFAEDLKNGNMNAEEFQADYKCLAQNEADTFYTEILLTVYGPNEFLINGVDTAQIDSSYKPKNPKSTFKKLYGFFGSIGDGSEGYNVDILINTHLIKGSNFGYMKYWASGPDGFYSVFYKCIKYEVMNGDKNYNIFNLFGLARR